MLFLNHNVAWRGGTFFRAFHLARQLALRGHKVTLLTISPTARVRFREETVSGVQLVETPDLLWGRGRTGWDCWDAGLRAVWCGRQPWDLVHAFDSRPVVVLPALYLKARGCRLWMDWADWWGRGGTQSERRLPPLLGTAIAVAETFFEERFRSFADRTTVITSALGGRAARLGVAPATILHLPQGCNIDSEPRDRRSARQRLGLDVDAKLVGHVGALFPGDADLLRETFEQVMTRVSGATLALIGNHRIRHQGWGFPPDHVLDSGYLSAERLADFVAACDVMLLPLRDTVGNRARWPSKLNDYMSAGRPTVATAVGDLRATFAEYGVGIATEVSSEALAEAVVSLLREPERAEQIGAHSRRVAEAHFSWHLIAEDLEKAYHADLARHGGHVQAVIV